MTFCVPGDGWQELASRQQPIALAVFLGNGEGHMGKLSRIMQFLFGVVTFLALYGCAPWFWQPADEADVSAIAEKRRELDETVRKERPRVFVPRSSFRQLPAPELPMTEEVRREIQHFTRRDPRYIPLALQRRRPLEPVLRQIFTDEGVPHELIHVATIESGYRPHVRSPSGAVGLWQFMKGTARAYGLHVGLFRDERKDIILSSLAAARHLRDLYAAYDDWLLALAAYNAGSGAVDRALIRANSDDFWALARGRHLKYQTRRYVPKFIAVNLIEKNPRRFGVDPCRYSLTLCARVKGKA